MFILMSRESSVVDVLSEYIYDNVLENYEVLLKDENVSRVLDVEKNSMCHWLRVTNPLLTTRDVQSRALTLLLVVYLLLHETT